MTFAGQIRADYQRYRATGWPPHAVFAAQGFWASCVYRFGHAAVVRSRGTMLAPAVWLCAALAQKTIEVLTGVSLPAACEIGPGLYISHFGPIVVHHQARIGADCCLSQGVTIGVRGRGARDGAPVLGDRVHVAPNATILGPVEIGDDTAIGPGAVVTQSVPAFGSASGNPASVVVGRGSVGLIRTRTSTRCSAPRIAGHSAESGTGDDAPPRA